MNRRTSGAAQPVRSDNAETWIVLCISTNVERGKREATTRAPDEAVMLSRSPLITSVGTAG